MRSPHLVFAFAVLVATSPAVLNAAPTVGPQFDGINVSSQGPIFNSSPPANFTVGHGYSGGTMAVGKTHIVQSYLGFYRVCNKTTQACQNFKQLDELFQNPPFLVGQCWNLFDNAFLHTNGSVAYDSIADRWLFVVPSVDTNAPGACVALSDTNDPGGTYTRNFFPMPLYQARHPGPPH